MNKREKKIVKEITALAIAGAFFFQQIAWAYPIFSPSPRPSPIEGEGDKIAAAVTSAIGGGLRGESFIHGGLTGAAIGGVQLVGVKNNWDPALTSVASLTAGSLTMGSLRGFEGNIKDENGNIIGYGPISFEEGISQIVLPDLAQNLTFVGVQKLGVQLGLTPQQANLAALPLSISVGGAARGNDASAIGQAVSSGLAKGVTSLVLTQALGGDGNDLGTAVTGRAVTGAIEAGLNGQNIFSGIATALGQSTLNAISFDDSQGFVRQQAELIEFGQIAREQGIENAIDQHATAIFQRDSVESMLKSGQTIAQQIREKMANGRDVTLEDGTRAKEIELGAREGAIKMALDEAAGKLGYVEEKLSDGTVVRKEGTFAFDQTNGRVILKDGTITEVQPSGMKWVSEVNNYDSELVSIYTQDGVDVLGKPNYKSLLTLTPQELDEALNLLMADGTIGTGKLRSSDKKVELDFKDGSLQGVISSRNIVTGELAANTDNPEDIVTTEVKQTADGKVETVVKFGQKFLDMALDAGVNLQKATRENVERSSNYVNHWGWKTDAELKADFDKTISTMRQYGQTGDVILVGGTGVSEFGIRTLTNSPVHHSAYLEKDEKDPSKLWVIDAAPRNDGKSDVRRWTLDQWLEQNKGYQFIEVGRQNKVGAGQGAVDYITQRFVLNQADNTTFLNAPPYDQWGAGLGWLGLGKGDNKEFCSELVCDVQDRIGEPLPGLPQNSWRTPGDIYRALPQWGKSILEIAKEAEAKQQ